MLITPRHRVPGGPAAQRRPGRRATACAHIPRLLAPRHRGLAACCRVARAGPEIPAAIRSIEYTRPIPTWSALASPGRPFRLAAAHTEGRHTWGGAGLPGSAWLSAHTLRGRGRVGWGAERSEDRPAGTQGQRNEKESLGQTTMKLSHQDRADRPGLVWALVPAAPAWAGHLCPTNPPLYSSHIYRPHRYSAGQDWPRPRGLRDEGARRGAEDEATRRPETPTAGLPGGVSGVIGPHQGPPWTRRACARCALVMPCAALQAVGMLQAPRKAQAGPGGGSAGSAGSAWDGAPSGSGGRGREGVASV